MPALLNSLIRYKAWANQLIFDTVLALPASEVEAPRPVLWGSIVRTLHHVYAMDKVWQAHLLGQPHGYTSRNPEFCPTLSQLWADQQQLDAWYGDYAAQLSSPQAEEVVAFTYIGGGEGQMSRQDILLHVVNHGTYHRGHVSGLLYQIPVPSPTTDLPVYLREVAAG
ncbi:damage-inducible protein DinB [Pokkaliibacter plantistimulans]|uniref:Damage-inducible protein DinB n=1 Tax=Pokkaliibacter plantistimulans TaxID=1635171 RepID=A0ABX5LVR4_9GAMM|nr:DinB family protein [Pokkaliibacter plantistimulans]PXF29248.1 damage-inducible protein DinB [Pokkaliibacter plantistimulans]